MLCAYPFDKPRQRPFGGEPDTDYPDESYDEFPSQKLKIIVCLFALGKSEVVRAAHMYDPKSIQFIPYQTRNSRSERQNEQPKHVKYPPVDEVSLAVTSYVVVM